MACLETFAKTYHGTWPTPNQDRREIDWCGSQSSKWMDRYSCCNRQKRSIDTNCRNGDFLSLANLGLGEYGTSTFELTSSNFHTQLNSQVLFHFSMQSLVLFSNFDQNVFFKIILTGRYPYQGRMERRRVFGDPRSDHIMYVLTILVHNKQFYIFDEKNTSCS